MRKVFLYILFLMIVVPSYSQISRGGKPFTYDSVTHRKVEEQTRKRPEINNVVVVADLDKATEEARIEQLKQETVLVAYPHKELLVASCASNVFDEQCFLIQTRDEFNKLCRKRGFSIRIGGGDVIDFSKEIILGFKDDTHAAFPPSHHHFQVMQDKNTKNIHFFVHNPQRKRSGISTREGRLIRQTWITVPKPADNYQIHFHLEYNINETVTIILTHFAGA